MHIHTNIHTYRPLIQQGYKAKILNASNSPLCLTAREIDILFDEFCNIVGEDSVSVNGFEGMYVCMFICMYVYIHIVR